MISRRSLMVGAGAVASIPLLAQLERGLGGGVAAADGEMPKRLIIFWNPQGNCSAQDDSFASNGLSPIWPEGFGADFDLSYDPAAPTPGRILAPLAPHQQDLLVMRGFNQPHGNHRVTPHCGFEISDGSHGFGTRSVLTAVCPYVAENGSQFGGGISLDQLVARELGADTPRSSMVLTCGGHSNGNHRGFISYTGANAPVVPLGPQDAYLNAFGSTIDGDQARIAAIRARRGSALDIIRAEAARLRRRLPASEREKLDTHLEAVRSLERDLDRTATCQVDPLGSTDQHFPDHFRQQAKTIAAAVACNVSRVFTVMAASAGGDSSADLRYFDPTWPTNYHSTGHATSGNTGDPEVTGDPAQRRQAIEVMTRVSEFYAQWIADLITELKAIPEGDGNAFDNTIILWATEMSNGDHGINEWPFVVAGGGWKFQNGNYWNHVAEPYSYDYRYGDLLTAVAQGMGLDIERFGDVLHSAEDPSIYSHLWTPGV